MTRAFLSQTNFSAGELDPRMLGRSDLRSFENGAAKLRNVVVETTGGVRRRPGMAYVAPAAGRGRLVDLEIGPGFAYLLAFSDFQVDVYRDGVLRATVLDPVARTAARADRLGPARAQPSGHPSGHPAAAAQARERHGLDDRPVAIRRVRFASRQHRAVRPVRCSRCRDAVHRHHRDGHAEHVRRRVRGRAPGRHRADEGQADPIDQHPNQHSGGRPRAADPR